jgi:putative PIN family toxin of toxin-antitoxin system
LIIRALEKWEFILVISPEILTELIGVIARPKFHKVIERKTASGLIETIKAQGLLVRPSISLNIVKDDPDDNIFLEAAVTAKANRIVSLDNDLPSLKAFNNIKIITPSAFLSLLSKSR